MTPQTSARPARYLRAALRLTLLAVLALGLAACGSSGGKTTDSVPAIAFGRTGGNIRPVRYTPGDGIAVNYGAVVKLEGKLEPIWSGFKSRQCPGTLLDAASEYISFEGRTVRVHGNCEPQFTRIWNELVATYN